MKHKEFKNSDEALNYYLNLPYARVFEENNDESGHYFFGKILELEGCWSDGDTLDELNVNLQDALLSWLSVAVLEDAPIPEPIDVDSCSGKLTVRAPKSLHAKLLRDAKAEGVSLNKYMIYKLSQ